MLLAMGGVFASGRTGLLLLARLLARDSDKRTALTASALFIACGAILALLAFMFAD